MSEPVNETAEAQPELSQPPTGPRSRHAPTPRPTEPRRRRRRDRSRRPRRPSHRRPTTNPPVTTPTTRRLPAPVAASAWSRRVTSRRTTSRSCSRSPTWTATSTWTSRVTGRPSPSSGPTCRSSSATQGEVLEALQELTRLAVYRETGERSRLMLDVSGHRANRRTTLEEQAARDRRPGQGVRRARDARPDVAVRAQGRARRRLRLRPAGPSPRAPSRVATWWSFPRESREPPCFT